MKKLIAAVLALCLLAGCSSGASALTVDVPQGFEKTSTKGVDAYYICADNSNINWVADKKSEVFSQTTAELLEKEVIAAVNDQKEGGMELSVTTNSFDFTKIAGYPAYIWDAAYTVEDTAMRQLVVCIDAAKQYTVTYTDTTADEKWMDAFYESAHGLILDQ